MFEIRESAIHGKGLFATREFTDGTVIGHVEGIPTTLDGPHVLWIGDTDEAVEVVNELRFINHDHDANAAYLDDLTVVALRDIQPGEEITHHYGEDWVAPPELPLPLGDG